MKVCVFNWRDGRHPRAGGAEAYTAEVFSPWVAMGDEVTWFAGAAPGLPERDVTDRGVEIVRRGGRLGVYPAAWRWWREEGRRRGFDLVIDEVNTIPFGTPMWVRDAAVVGLIHQTAQEVWTAEMGPLGHVGAAIEPLLLRPYRDLPVATVSPSSKESLLAMGLRNVTVLPQGTDPMPIPSLQVEAPGRPTLIWVGRLAANKRPLDAIAAFELVRSACPEAALWVVGDGPQRTEVEQAARRVRGVTVHGRVSLETRNALMAAADLLVTTSVREGWGLNVSEAALLGTPSIGYRVPGLVDSVPASGGMLCDPSPQALASAVQQVIERQVSLHATRSTVSWAELSRRFREFALDAHKAA